MKLDFNFDGKTLLKNGGNRLRRIFRRCRTNIIR